MLDSFLEHVGALYVSHSTASRFGAIHRLVGPLDQLAVLFQTLVELRNPQADGEIDVAAIVFYRDRLDALAQALDRPFALFRGDAARIAQPPARAVARNASVPGARSAA